MSEVIDAFMFGLWHSAAIFAVALGVAVAMAAAAAVACAAWWLGSKAVAGIRNGGAGP